MKNLDKENLFKYKKALEKIEKANNILLITHLSPDGDALGSIGTMSSFLKSINKKHTSFCVDSPMDCFSFIPHVHEIVSDIEKINFSEFDLIIVLDCGSVERTGIKYELLNRNQYLIEFDHHPKIRDYADLEIRLTECASTTENLYNFFKVNKIKINKDIATSILTGILTDTANFIHQNTSERVLSISSELMLYGAQYKEITQKVWYNRSLTSLRVLGKVLGNLKINKKYNFGFSFLSWDEIGAIENDEDMFDAITTFLNNLGDIRGFVFLREEKDPETGEMHIKGSLRSTCNKTDVSKIARLLGGGGHPKSSGFMIKGARIAENGNGLMIE